MSINSNIVTASQPLAAPLPEIEWAAIRAQRNQCLRSTDFTQLPDFPATDAQRTEALAYRKALRDIPEKFDDPSTLVWPELPNFLK